MKKLPLGIQTFRKVINENNVYVDKTQYIYKIINGVSSYFLSRPRRFGKSLLLDTIAEAFSGDKELFSDLWLYKSDYNFEMHPVLRLDMSRIACKTPDLLEESISLALKSFSTKEDLSVIGNSPSDIFQYLIEALHEKYKKRVVVLIDEYDKPILDYIDNINIAEANRGVLKAFYGVLKPMDPHLRLTFITGVSRFTKTSIFSELNNLLDISMNMDYSDICGITIDELDLYFAEHINDLIMNDDFARYSDLRNEILKWYDGYSWNGTSRVINPFSLLSFFIQKRFADFWYSTGTPTFLIKLIKGKPASFISLNDLDISERALDTFDINKINIAPLLFQTGYLTIKEKRYRENLTSYLLHIPNFEVREAFYLNLLSEFTESDDSFTETSYWKIKDSLGSGDLNNILVTLRTLFASIPYQLHVNREAYYHSIFLMLMNILGFTPNSEVSVSGGRIDATLELEGNVYIFEFKYRDCAQDISDDQRQLIFNEALDNAISQVKSKGYHKKYIGCGKSVILAAFVFLGRDNIEMRVEPIE